MNIKTGRRYQSNFVFGLVISMVTGMSTRKSSPTQSPGCCGRLWQVMESDMYQFHICFQSKPRYAQRYLTREYGARIPLNAGDSPSILEAVQVAGREWRRVYNETPR